MISSTTSSICLCNSYLNDNHSISLKNWGSFNYQTDYCPVALNSNSIKCDNAEKKPLFNSPNEFYGEGSRCFNVIGDEKESLCLASSCNEDDQVLEVFVGDITYICDRDGQKHTLPNGDGLFECPRLKSVCPQ